MNIILHGSTGQMGRAVDALVASGTVGGEIVARVSPDYLELSQGCYRSLSEYDGPADVVIDFSHHSATLSLLDYCLARSLPIVLCTTGQTEEEKDAICKAAETIPIFRSANMSLGVALLAELSRRAASLFPDADIEIVETHHNRKLDVPSGTALMLADAIKEARPQAKNLVGRHENGKRTQEEIGIHSLRLAGEVGKHEVILSNGKETITLTHKAESRALFATGALRAALFLAGKPAGLYNMTDLLEETL